MMDETNCPKCGQPNRATFWSDGSDGETGYAVYVATCRSCLIEYETTYEDAGIDDIVLDVQIISEFAHCRECGNEYETGDEHGGFACGLCHDCRYPEVLYLPE